MITHEGSKTLHQRGFTLIEVLVALALSSMVAGGIFLAYKAQQDSYVTQEQVAMMQQNLRAAMFFMEREIRMAGYDTSQSLGAGVQTAAPNAIRFTMDLTGGENDGMDNDEDGDVDEDTDGVDNDGDGSVDEADEQDEWRFGDGVLDDANEDVTYSLTNDDGSLFDVNGDGLPELRRADGAQPAAGNNSAQELIAENVEALGFAYAFDANNDGLLDTYDAVNAPTPMGIPRETERTIWAIDSDGDNDLDTNLDTDGDGDIDAQDGPGMGGNGFIGGQALFDFNGSAIPDVAVANIRAVRIWLLIRSGRDARSEDFTDLNTYVVSRQVISPYTDGDPNNDQHRRRLLMFTVKCRNMGI